MENSYTIKEVMESGFKEMREHLTEIKTQTTKTNGRVNSLEKSRIQVWTAIGVLTTLGGVIIYLSVMAIDTKIQRGIQTALQENVQGIYHAK